MSMRRHGGGVRKAVKIAPRDGTGYSREVHSAIRDVDEKEEIMRRMVVLCILVFLLVSSCAVGKSGKPLTEVKAGLECIQYEKGMRWEAVAATLGQPDVAPLPEPGTDLSKNTRVYMKRTVILSVERQEVTEADKVRFHEVVTGLEICREK
jgi:hypothetical protein